MISPLQNGDLVFADAQARKDLEKIIHPGVVEAIERWFRSLDAQAHPFAIADVPLLYEAGREKDYDAVIVTACEPATQIRRVVARDGISETEARQRIAAQLPLSEKVGRANYVIKTDGLVANTNAQVHEVYKRLMAGG
jgi:dephospho-CoA kinase